MNEGLIPHRYAKALLKFAIEKGADKHLYALMNRLQDAFRQFPDLDASMSNPFIDSAKKVQLLLTAAGAQPTDEVYSDFLKLLRNNNRLSMARAIAIAYADAYRKMNHIYQVEVSAAAPLDKNSEERLKKAHPPASRRRHDGIQLPARPLAYRRIRCESRLRTPRCLG